MDVQLHLKSITKDFSGHIALENISCSLDGSGVWGLLGPNGAGKSTLMNILCGILPPSSGSIYCSVDNIRWGFAPEHAPLYHNMKVEKYLFFCAALSGVKREDVHRVIGQLALEAVAKQYIGTLSRGFRQRVNIAQSLLGDPQVLILDEPFVGLDPTSVRELRELIISLGQKHLVLISSHQLRELEDICGKLIFLHQGKLLAIGEREYIQKNISATSMVEIEVANSDALNVEEFSAKFNGRAITQKLEDQRLKFTFQYVALEDCRPQMVNYFVQAGVELLAINKKELHLEDLFKQMVEEC